MTAGAEPASPLGEPGLLRFNPDGPGGSLTAATIKSLCDGLESLNADPRVATIYLSGTPGRFAAGIDVGFFRQCLEAGQPARILQFTRAANELLGRLARNAKPVIAWIDGPAIGAGLELALACQRVVATPKAKFAFPETSLGIYPGMGGTQRAARRIGVALAKWLIFTGSILPPEHALQIGLVDALVDGQLASGAESGATPPTVERSSPPPLSPRFQGLADLFARHSLAELLAPEFPQPADPQQVRALVQLRGNAPVALRLAESVIDEGINLPLQAGLEVEFSRLAEVFATEDALVGIRSLGQAARPRFCGR
jgi:enoyl-CoA hydratase/3-hydroxyacyl-CoA dehydrogenase